MADNVSIGDVQQLLLQLLQKALGSLIASPALSTFLANAGTGMISRNVGSSSLWSTPMYANTTLEGVNAYMQRNSLQALQQRVQKDFLTESRAELFASLIDKTTPGFSDWVQRPGNEHKTAADRLAEIRNQAYGYAVNPFSAGAQDFIMKNMLGQTNEFTAAERLAGTAANMARHGLLNTQSNYIGASQALVSNLFTGDWDPEKNAFDQSIKYNKNNWGGLNKGEAATIAQTLSAETDFLSGVDTSKAGDMREATERFREAVRSYSEALAPLKDVLGDDVQGIIDTLQNITGQSLGSITTSRVTSLANKLANRFNSGRYNPAEVQQMTAGMNMQIQQHMGLSAYNYIGAPEQAMAALDAMGMVALPTNRTKMQMQAAAQDFILSTSNSGAEDLTAKAYAVWADSHNNASFEDFAKAVGERTAGPNGMDYQHALLAVNGVKSAWELEKGLASENYQNAKLNGDAARLTRDAYTDKIGTDLGIQLSRRKGFVEAIGGKYGSAEGRDAARQITSDMISLMQYDQSVVTMDDKKRTAYLQTLTDEAGNRTYTDEQIQNLNSAFNYVNSSQRFSGMRDKLLLQNAEERVAREDKLAATRRQTFKDLGISIDSKDSWIRELFMSDNITEALQQKVATGAVLEGLSKYEKEDMTRLLGIGLTQGQKIASAGGTKAVDVDQAHQIASRFYDYAVDKGAGNMRFQNDLQTLRVKDKQIAALKAKGLDETDTEYAKLLEERDTVQAQLLAYTYVDDPESLEAALEGGIATGKGVSKSSADKARAIRNWVEEANQGKTSFKENLRRNAIETGLAEAKETGKLNTGAMKGVWEDFKKATEITDKTDIVKSFNTYYKANREKYKDTEQGRALDDMRDLVNKKVAGLTDSSVRNNPNNPGGLGGDIFGVLADLPQAITDLVSVLGEIKPLLDKQHAGASQPVHKEGIAEQVERVRQQNKFYGR